MRREVALDPAASQDELRWLGMGQRPGLAERDVIARDVAAGADRLALPDEYRQVILLARIVGLSHADLAREMGRSETAVRTLLHRALARLAREMGPGAAG